MKKVLTALIICILAFGTFACGTADPGDTRTNIFTITSGDTAEISVGDTYEITLDYSPDKRPAKVTRNRVALGSIEKLDDTKFKVTALEAGVLRVSFRESDDTVLGFVEITITETLPFPRNPNFNALGRRTSDFTSWTEFGAHDPSFIEVDGRYYAFSTDVSGTRPGYQIRVSDDLLRWRYEQTAFDFDDLQAADYLAGTGEFQEAFDWCKTATAPDDIVTSTSGSFSFWAPHIMKGTDGKFWLYYSLTSYFGGSTSYIGLAKSDNVLGPYKHDSNIVKSLNGSGTPNAIDAQVFFTENDPTKGMWMVYGSFSRGIHVMELDPETGRRANDAEFPGGTTFDEDYYGVRIATGSLEGPVVSVHNVDEIDPDTEEVVSKTYYYLVTSYGDLTSTYHMRAARSESPTGPYIDITGKTQNASTNNDWAAATGDKLMGWYQWQGYDVDFSAPGHNDLYTLEDGTDLVIYHCRTYYWEITGQESGNNFHYLYLSQYALNEDGRMVINPNRYAKETLRAIDPSEVYSTELSSGNFKMVRMQASTSKQVSVNVQLKEDGTITGTGITGTWEIKGDYYITVMIGEEEFKGVIMPAWLQEEGRAGLTITALSSTTGMAMYMNADY